MSYRYLVECGVGRKDLWIRVEGSQEKTLPPERSMRNGLSKKCLKLRTRPESVRAARQFEGMRWLLAQDFCSEF